VVSFVKEQYAIGYTIDGATKLLAHQAYGHRRIAMELSIGKNHSPNMMSQRTLRIDMPHLQALKRYITSVEKSLERSALWMRANSWRTTP
jgi:hypothetical protein